MIGWLVGWLNGVLRRFQQSFNHGDSSHYSCLSWFSPALSRSSEVSWPRRLLQKTQRIHCGSSPEPLDYESNALPLSHAGHTETFYHYMIGPAVSQWQKKLISKLIPNLIT